MKTDVWDHAQISISKSADDAQLVETASTALTPSPVCNADPAFTFTREPATQPAPRLLRFRTKLPENAEAAAMLAKHAPEWHRTVRDASTEDTCSTTTVCKIVQPGTSLILVQAAVSSL